MSTGIGGGIVANGEIYHGANDSAGEVGHQILLPDGPLCGCGKYGCLEALCSGPSIARRAQEAIANQPHTKILALADGQIDGVRSEHVLQAARDGDALGMALVEETAYYMGWGIANLVNILNPEIVLLGTIAVAAGDLLLDPIRRTVTEMAMQRPLEAVKIMPAELGDSIGDLAAISLVIGTVSDRRNQPNQLLTKTNVAGYRTIPLKFGDNSWSVFKDIFRIYRACWSVFL